jgi:hypothetical protein
MVIKNFKNSVSTAPMTDNVDVLYSRYRSFGGMLSRDDFFGFITVPSNSRQKFLSTLSANYHKEDNLFVKVLY